MNQLMQFAFIISKLLSLDLIHCGDPVTLNLWSICFSSCALIPDLDLGLLVQLQTCLFSCNWLGLPRRLSDLEATKILHDVALLLNRQ